MTLSPRAIEAAAEALRERDMAGRITIPWSSIPKSQRKKWIERAETAITAYHAALAVDGLCLVPKEPTMAMLYAGERAWINDPLKRSSTLYRAMIAAASTGDSPRQETP